MAAKNAIISSNSVGSARDLVRNNYNGYIFKNDDYKNLAKKIYKIYNNKKKIIKFGNNSSKIISSWTFNECYVGLNKAIKFALKKWKYESKINYNWKISSFSFSKTTP